MTDITEEARLITEPVYTVKHTTVCLTDERSALSRGLFEYLSSNLVGEITWADQTYNIKVYGQWAEQEQQARYPAVTIYSTDELTYDQDEADDQAMRNDEPIMVDDSNNAIFSIGECAVRFVVECWANNPEERAAVVKIITDLLNPVTFMYGFRLVLPFYFNNVATFSLRGNLYIDNEQDAQRRYRKAVLSVQARMKHIRLWKAVQANSRLRTDLEVT